MGVLPQWKYQVGDEMSSSAAVAANGNVYVGCQDYRWDV
jgi:hypothetical protein